MTRDPASGFGIELYRGGEGRLLLFDPDGAPAGEIGPPPGYRLSHLVETPNFLLVVGQGDVAIDGWPDWHFEIDVAKRCLVRAAPAY